MLDITIIAYTRKTYPTTQTTKNEETKSFEKSIFSTKLGVMVSVNIEGTYKSRQNPTEKNESC